MGHGTALPADNNGHVRQYSNNRTLAQFDGFAARVLVSQSEFDQGPTNMRCVSRDSCGAVIFVARALQGARAKR